MQEDPAVMFKFQASICLVAFAFAGLPAYAQEVDDPGRMKQQNSHYCGYTFFTNKADTLDFRGSETRRCFDMKGGDDVLILNKDLFPNGVEIYTGTGQDTVWATDGPDLVVDADGEDKEIRTYGGDDTIEIRVPIDETPSRDLSVTGRTILRPGPGKNQIKIGQDVYSNAMARWSPDVWLTSDAGAEDRVLATCGRPTLSGDFDLRALEVPETSRIDVVSDGCNVGIFGLYGDAALKMSGGRLAVQTYNEGFRIPAGSNVPKLTGEVVGGLALMLDIDRSSPATNFSWEGSGSAFLRASMPDRTHGGSFHVRSAREVHYQGEVPSGAAHFDLAARGRVLVDLTGGAASTQARFSLAGSRMDISWRLSGEGGFPTIVNDEPVTYQETTFIMPEIDYKQDRVAMGDMKDAAQISDPDEQINGTLVPGAPNVEQALTGVTIAPGTTRLRLQLRRDNDRFAKCVSVRLVDEEGRVPDQMAQCSTRGSALQRMAIDEAGAFDRILIEGDGVDIEIPINQASRFKVGRIEIEL